ncbi:WhiB family transcriptional regulator [Pseudonocardiaceae bacterium YIM PH 21723]|nr:WhiB family transcriptional regulator [Pseudonocardiaceae bacterium YIM PH 21723]
MTEQLAAWQFHAEDTDWSERGLCREDDPELWFPVGFLGPAMRQTAEAQRVCAACPVAAQCLAWAKKTKQEHGIWGGVRLDDRDPAPSKPLCRAGLHRMVGGNVRRNRGHAPTCKACWTSRRQQRRGSEVA